MACNISLEGISRDCNKSRGGILRVWLANRNSVTAVVDTDAAIRALDTLTANPADAFKLYEPEPFTSSLVTNPNPSPETNGLDVQSVLTMVFARITDQKQREFQELTKDAVVALVEDANHTFIYLGFDEPLYLTDGSQIETGTGRTDLNGYTIELTDYSVGVPYIVPEDVANRVINPPEAAKISVDTAKKKA